MNEFEMASDFVYILHTNSKYIVYTCKPHILRKPNLTKYPTTFEFYLSSKMSNQVGDYIIFLQPSKKYELQHTCKLDLNRKTTQNKYIMDTILHCVVNGQRYVKKSFVSFFYGICFLMNMCGLLVIIFVKEKKRVWQKN